MSSRLDRITNWEEQARLAHYRASEMAKLIQVSGRHLRRYFLAMFGVSPQQWIDRVRFREAHRLIVMGESVKSTAYSLGFKQSSHFCASFRRAFGATPRAMAGGSWSLMSAKDNRCPQSIIETATG